MSNVEDNQVQAQLVRAGMVREGDPDGPGPEFVPKAVEEMFRHWITPTRPGVTKDNVTRALIIFNQDNSLEIRINEEVEFIAVAGLKAELVNPEDSFVGQIVDLYPDGVHPDLGWIGFCVAREGRVVVCDFRRNRDAVLGLLNRAENFHRSAVLALGEGMLEPGVEHLCTAAELGVMTLIQLEGWDDKKNHKNRRAWLAREAAHGSVPASFANTFDVLMMDRNAARYGEASLATNAAGATGLADDVRKLIEYAKLRRG